MEQFTLHQNALQRMSVCGTCTEILSHWPELMEKKSETSWEVDEAHFKNDPKGLRWSWKRQDMKGSACHFCCFVEKSIEANLSTQYQDDDYIMLKAVYMGSANIIPEQRQTGQDKRVSRYYRPKVQLYQNNGIYRHPEAYAYILPLASCSDYWENTRQSRVFHGRAVSPGTNFELAQHWLNSCQTKHVGGPIAHILEDCQPTPRRIISHSRLVDVKLRCVVELDSSQDYIYAALSYVWGSTKRFLLTTENLETLLAPNALSPDNKHVPATFRDALTVAGRLNIPYVFIDAICILQDNVEQLTEHMDSMDSIYSSATLTIVSDTENAENGIPGISSPRTTHQATFLYRDQKFISTTKPLDTALSDSRWETRAWCLQEKVFSKRLLIFSPSQMFFRCKRAKRFEDTILQLKEEDREAETEDFFVPWDFRTRRDTFYTSFEETCDIHNQNFWHLVQMYTRRQLSFDSDIIRAFTGILKFVEPMHGVHVYGVPSSLLGSGLAWRLSQPKMSLRRPEYPSWSWAGWNGSTGIGMEFENALPHKLMIEIWVIEWHYYRMKSNGDYELTTFDSSKNKSRARGAGDVPETLGGGTIAHEKGSDSQSACSESRLPSSSFNIPAHQRPAQIPHLSDSHSTQQQPATYSTAIPQHNTAGIDVTKPRCLDSELHDCERCSSWLIPDHPGGPDYVHHRIPPLNHNPQKMPPLLHILRFYTSSATLFIDVQHAERKWEDVHSIRIPSTGKAIGVVGLDPQWPGRGKEAEFIYIGIDAFTSSCKNKRLILMLIEPAGEKGIMRKVTVCILTNLYDWIEARPVWKLVNLA